MTTKRTRFDRRKKLLVAPGREPDEIDYLMLALRANTTTLAPTKTCWRCGKNLSLKFFAKGEASKQRPMCLACVSSPLRKAPDWVVQAIANAPQQPKREDPHVVYERLVQAKEDDEAFDAFMAYVEEEDIRYEAERSAFLRGLDLEENQ